jgi:hypothetical protein
MHRPSLATAVQLRTQPYSSPWRPKKVGRKSKSSNRLAVYNTPKKGLAAGEAHQTAHESLALQRD